MLLVVTDTEMNSFLIAAAVTVAVVFLARLVYRQIQSGNKKE